MLISEAEERLLQQTRLVRSIDEQATSLRLDKMKALLEAAPQELEEIVRRLQLEYGVRKLGEESGEVAKALKRHLDYGEPLDVSSLQGELGNVLFFVTFLARCAGISLESIVERQVKETEERFGQGWTVEAAAARAHKSDVTSKPAKGPHPHCNARKNSFFSGYMGLDTSDRECGEEQYIIAHRPRRLWTLNACESCAKLCAYDGKWSVSDHEISVPRWWPKMFRRLDETLSDLGKLSGSEKRKREDALWNEGSLIADMKIAIVEGPSLSEALWRISKASPRTFVKVILPTISHLKNQLFNRPVDRGFDTLEKDMSEWVENPHVDLADEVSRVANLAWDENWDGHGNYDMTSNLVASFLSDVAAVMRSEARCVIAGPDSPLDSRKMYRNIFDVIECDVRSIAMKNLVHDP